MQAKNRFGPEYKEGVKEFMEFARDRADSGNRIRCPCRKCKNMIHKTLDKVEDDLFIVGIDQGYTWWIHHGEDFHQRVEATEVLADPIVPNEEDEDVDDMQDIIGDVLRGTIADTDFAATSTSQDIPPMGDAESEKFSRLLRDAQRPLYPGCRNFSKLNFLTRLLHLKTINRWSNKSFDMLLGLLKEVLPEGETLPKSHYEAKSLMRDLGLGYILIHACINDCVLYWKEHENVEECPQCGESRWKYDEAKRKKIPQKVLRYFPLKPRLQRLFTSSKTAEDMRWHKEKRLHDDNTLRHPADSEAWQHFDKQYDWFAEDSRNVRLGLASDGFNPFGNMSSSYSMWPVILMPYNLPPWLCMKESFFMMSLLIPGPKSPGNDIDVYLRPLVDELNELWSQGVQTYDTFAEQTFRLHAAVLWTINDFPAYGNLSGWSTKGKLACPTCSTETCSLSLKHGKKTCYMGHRRFLPRDHSWRRKTVIFDGKQDHRPPPKELSAEDVLQQLSNIEEVRFGKAPHLKKRKRTVLEYNWRKKSIFFSCLIGVI